MRLAYRNGAIWAVGNGLVSTTLIVYLAQDLGAKRIGLSIGLILAARHVVGLLRLSAPAVIGRWVDRKRFCLGAYLAAALLLTTLPLVAAPGILPSAETSLAALVSLWCVYHLLQYVGTIALWSWLADLVPLRIRGRFLGIRQRWIVAGEAVAMLASGWFIYQWHSRFPDQYRWIAYAASATLGACCMLGALVPLARIPRMAVSPMVRHGATLRSMLAPLADGPFLRLLLFGCWFSLSNGLTQSIQYSFPKQVLGASLFLMLALQTGMRLGQLTVSPWIGRTADRLGNRPVMLVSLLLVAQGPLFYFFSTAGQWWWFAGAWVVWIAYAGLNICLPNLLLKLSPADGNTPHIATFYAVTGLCYALNTILGGALFDRFGEQSFVWFGGATLDYYGLMFLLGWVARCLGLVVLLLVIEGPNRPISVR